MEGNSVFKGIKNPWLSQCSNDEVGFSMQARSRSYLIIGVTSRVPRVLKYRRFSSMLLEITDMTHVANIAKYKPITRLFIGARIIRYTTKVQSRFMKQ